MLDCGYTGIQQTLTAISNEGLIATGYIKDGILQFADIKKNGFIIRFYGITMLTNFSLLRKQRTYDIPLYSDTNSLKNLHLNRDGADCVIVSIHWGKEYSKSIKYLEKCARLIESAGADCIVGHHQHVLAPIRRIVSSRNSEKIPVFYGLGNLLGNMDSRYWPGYSNAQKGSSRRSVLVSLTLKKDKDNKISDVIKIHPVWIHNNLNEVISKKEKVRKAYPVMLINPDNGTFYNSNMSNEIRYIQRDIQ